MQTKSSLFFPALVGLMLFFAILACTRETNNRVEVTSTPDVPLLSASNTPAGPTETPIIPTPNPTRVSEASSNDGFYIVQPGDTLAILAARFGTTVDEFVTLNALINPNVLEVGQVLRVPGRTVQASTGFKLVPDSEIVYGPSASQFDLAAYVKFKPGFLRAYSEDIGGELWSGVQIIGEVATNYSVNPRILLAILEYQGRWLSQTNPTDQQKNYPMGITRQGREGLFRQVLDAADLLNEGYYGWRYEGLQSTLFIDGAPLLFAPDINAGTAAIQYYFAQFSTRAEWEIHTGAQGFFQTYLSLFGDPFRTAVEPLVPNDLAQPIFSFPFPKGEIWYFTGGPHGGYNSGSAWASIDFAPPAPPDDIVAREGACYISPNYVTAVAPGVIARSGKGFVILDLDYDGNEHTGWTVVYLHVSSRNIIAPGTRVNTGDKLGNPSCEGGFSNGTHLHIGRRYNGEWIPANCQQCTKDVRVPPFIMSDWTVWGIVGAEYQGTMTHPTITEVRQAEQGRDNPLNQVQY